MSQQQISFPLLTRGKTAEEDAAFFRDVTEQFGKSAGLIRTATANVKTLESQVATNTSDIAAHTVSIATNTANIAIVAGAVLLLSDELNELRAQVFMDEQ